MWDGREPDLKSQAKNATLVHAQPKHPPTDSDLRQIVNLETSLFTAQSEDNLAGSLIAQGGRGGPDFPGVCSPSIPGSTRDRSLTRMLYALSEVGQCDWRECQVAAVHRAGRNAVQQSPHEDFRRARIQRCSRPSAGHWHMHDLPQYAQCRQRLSFAMMNIGTGSPKADLPSYLILCNDGTQVLTTDPGRAMVTGKCADIGKFKVPGLRGLAGSSAVLPQRHRIDLAGRGQLLRSAFQMLLTDDEKTDLVAFMSTL